MLQQMADGTGKCLAFRVAGWLQENKYNKHSPFRVYNFLLLKGLDQILL